MKSNRTFLVFVFLFGLWLTGCPPKQSMVKLHLESIPKLNPDSSGNPNSVEVRIYQLKSKDRFERATFDALWNQERDTLVEDLINRQQKTVLPASQVPVEFQKDTQAMFLGVAAAFREASGDHWKKVVPLQAKQTQQSVTLSLREQGIDVQVSNIPSKKKK